MMLIDYNGRVVRMSRWGQILPIRDSRLLTYAAVKPQTRVVILISLISCLICQCARAQFFVLEWNHAQALEAMRNLAFFCLHMLSNSECCEMQGHVSVMSTILFFDQYIIKFPFLSFILDIPPIQDSSHHHILVWSHGIPLNKPLFSHWHPGWGVDPSHVWFLATIDRLKRRPLARPKKGLQTKESLENLTPKQNKTVIAQ